VAADGDVGGTRSEPGLRGEPAADLPDGSLAPGQVLGDRYQIRAFPGWAEVPEWQA
jgi:hypothetical protein